MDCQSSSSQSFPANREHQHMQVQKYADAPILKRVDLVPKPFRLTLLFNSTATVKPPKDIMSEFTGDLTNSFSEFSDLIDKNVP